MNKKENLDALLAALTWLIRTSFDVKDQFSPDDSIHAEMQDLILEARRNLAEHLRKLRALTPVELGLSLGIFKDTVLNLMLTGFSPSSMRFLQNHAAFSDISEMRERYVYEFAEPIDIFAAQSLEPLQLYAASLTDALLSAENPDNYTSKRRFDRYVYKKVLALLFAIESAGGRFDEDDDGGQESDASVPRRPFPPHLTGEAEEAIPEAAESVIEAMSLK